VTAETGDEFRARLGKVDDIRARGDDPYPVRFDRTHTLAEVREHWDDKVDVGASTDDVVRVAGRVLLERRQGKLSRALSFRPRRFYAIIDLSFAGQNGL